MITGAASTGFYQDGAGRKAVVPRDETSSNVCNAGVRAKTFRHR